VLAQGFGDPPGVRGADALRPRPTSPPSVPPASTSNTAWAASPMRRWWPTSSSTAAKSSRVSVSSWPHPFGP